MLIHQSPLWLYDSRDSHMKDGSPVKALPCVVFRKAGAPRPDEALSGLSTGQAVTGALGH